MRISKHISPNSRIENLLEMVIANQKTMLEEFDLIQQRMDRLEGCGVLPQQERKSIETFFTSKEVASMLNISIRALFTLRQRGEIGFTPMGKNIRFSSEQILAFKRKQAIINC